MEERIQKILAQAGYGSRRSCEELITAGRVKVNGKPVILGQKADAANDTIVVDGAAVPKRNPFVYIALYKPREVLSDIDPKDNRTTVRDLVNVPGHLFAVGRLDYDSEGLILLTNDGEMANTLTHPRYGHEKEYRVLIENRPDPEQLVIWRRGVVLADGTKTAPAQVALESQAGKGVWLRVILREGKKRQIREVGKQIGLHVERILRVRIGTLMLGDMKSGEWRYLTKDEIRQLKTPRINKAVGDGEKFSGTKPRPVSSRERSSSTRERPAAGRGRPPANRERPAANRERPAANRDRPAASRGKPAAGGQKKTGLR